MSNVYGDELLGMILPIVEQRLRVADWRIRESAILAIGAVAEGCTNGGVGASSPRGLKGSVRAHPGA